MKKQWKNIIKMSFNNCYPKRKDHRKQYFDSRKFDSLCRNHSSCPYCYQTRTFFDKKRRLIAQEQIKEYVNY